MRRHDFDPISLVLGLLVATTGFLFLTGRVDANGFESLRWLWPAPLIVLGLLMLLTAGRRVRGAEVPEEPEEPEGPEAPE